MGDDLIERLRANGLDECDEAIDRIKALEAALNRWETAAEKGSIYTRKDLEDAVAAAVQTVLDDVGYTYEQLGEDARALIAEYGGKSDV